MSVRIPDGALRVFRQLLSPRQHGSVSVDLPPYRRRTYDGRAAHPRMSNGGCVADHSTL